MFHIELKNGKRFATDGAVSILDAARANGLILDHSCRTGRCGLCRVGQVSGTTRLLREEESPESFGANSASILTCCRAPTSDIVIDATDLGRLASLTTGVHPCRIAAIESVAPTILKVTLRMPPTSRFAFLAGQYVNVIAAGVKRSYSVANAPRKDGTIDLLIRKVDGGQLSNYWFGPAAVNDLLRLEGPCGTFVLRGEPAGKVVFLATGTGIAPVIALIEEMRELGRVSNSNVRVYWGNRDVEDFFWQASPDVRIERTLSGNAERWVGRRGHVQDALVADIDSFEYCTIYACGSAPMIEAARRRLVAAGLPPHRFFADPFVASN